MKADFFSEKPEYKRNGGEGGIRTPGTSFSRYNGLANRRIQPLCHLSAVHPVAYHIELVHLSQCHCRGGCEIGGGSTVTSLFATT